MNFRTKNGGKLTKAGNNNQSWCYVRSLSEMYCGSECSVEGNPKELGEETKGMSVRIGSHKVRYEQMLGFIGDSNLKN